MSVVNEEAVKLDVKEPKTEFVDAGVLCVACDNTRNDSAIVGTRGWWQRRRAPPVPLTAPTEAVFKKWMQRLTR